MDPLSLLVTAWVLTVFFNRLPDVLRELEFAKRGEVSPAYEARLKRLADAGVDPATGGPARQVFANAWRDLWLDVEEDRARRREERRAARAAGERTEGWLDRARDRFDAAVTERADRWRQRTGDRPVEPEPVSPAPGGDPAGKAPFADETLGPAGPETPPTTVAEPGNPAPDPSVGEPGTPASFDGPDTTAGPTPAPAANPEPVRVESRLGDPIPATDRPAQPAQPALEGNTTMTALTHVTGVVSGAAEARAIQRQVEAATAAFEAAMRAVRNRIVHLGNQTLGEVQQATYSRVVAALQQAAEAAAAAEADAKRCAAETGPALGLVARNFDRLNS